MGNDIYGTTYFGGVNGQGVVYKYTSPTEGVIHSFGQLGDGSNPDSALFLLNGELYGTTEAGGVDREGTVFEVSKKGIESVLYSFKGGATDGATPIGAVTAVNGVLYGTTGYGGSNYGGTAFKVTTSGQESVLYNFGQGEGDGSVPVVGLLPVGNNLYGVTYYGGEYGYGTIFQISLTGQESVLYSFQGGADGANPDGPLIELKNVLYGTTAYGGANGDGTVFALRLN